MARHRSSRMENRPKYKVCNIRIKIRPKNKVCKDFQNQFKRKFSEERLRFGRHPGFIFESKKVNVQVVLIYTI